MNILPHKSWHVRTKQNIARVRRDEEKARKEEEEKLKRINLAEHESRIATLKARRGIPVETASDSNGTSFNLLDNFKDTVAKDSEKESEQKVEQEKWEVKAGIFNYLDGRYKYQTEKDDQWYIKCHEERFGAKEDSAAALKDDRLKQRHDPLFDIKRHLAEMKKSESVQSNPVSSSANKTVPKADIDLKNNFTCSPIKPKRKKDKKKRSKDKKRKKRKHTSRSESESSSDEGSSRLAKEALVHKLRQERLEREKKERIRYNKFMHGPTAEPTAEQTSAQKYNSQFNPHIARQNQIE